MAILRVPPREREQQVLFLKSAPALPIHGADISMFERIMLLRRHGWDGKLISTGRLEHAANFQQILGKLGLPFVYLPDQEMIAFTCCDVECRMYLGPGADHFTAADHSQIIPFFRKAIAELKPDSLIGNARDPVVLGFLSEQTDSPAVVFLTEDEFPRRDTPAAKDFTQSLSGIKTVVVASDYLRQSLHKEYGIGAQLLTNAVAVSNYRFSKTVPGRYITMMHPYIYKGAELFMQIAGAMPEKEFLVMAGTGAEYRALKPRLLACKNITLGSYSREVREIYERSRLVLVPSLWQEAFSRVIIEAFCSGTPVIASNRGGMRQAGGEAAIYLPVDREDSGSGAPRYNIEPWVQAIRQFDNPEFYRLRSAMALERTAEFELELEESLKRLSLILAGGA